MVQTYLTHRGKRRNMARPRAVMKQLIVEYVRNNPGSSRADIAEGLQRGSSPHLWTILDEMVAEGKLVAHLDRDYYPACWRYNVGLGGDDGAAQTQN
jgi:hypothetical protein